MNPLIHPEPAIGGFLKRSNLCSTYHNSGKLCGWFTFLCILVTTERSKLQLSPLSCPSIANLSLPVPPGLCTSSFPAPPPRPALLRIISATSCTHTFVHLLCIIRWACCQSTTYKRCYGDISSRLCGLEQAVAQLQDCTLAYC
jgi:hypothetical protein